MIIRFPRLVFIAPLCALLLAAPACQTAGQAWDNVKGCPVYHEEVAFPSGEYAQYANQRNEEEEQAGWFDAIYENIRESFEEEGVELEEIANGFKGDGVSLKKIVDPETGNTKELLVEIDGDVSFDHGSSELTPRARALVNKVAAAMAEYPETKCKIGGHTDSTGPRALNVRLSLARAISVKDAMIGGGIAESRVIEAKGYADDQKIIDTMAAEPRNRRVEIRVIVP